MKKPGHRMYYDRRAGVVRRAKADREVDDGKVARAPRSDSWDRRSSMTWEEFISHWEQRFAAS